MDIPEIGAVTFHADVQYIESLWQDVMVGGATMPVVDQGSARSDPLVFVPILEHLEFVYARQVRAFSDAWRVVMYRRPEARIQSVGLGERTEELRRVLDALGIAQAHLVGHGDAAMVLFEFALRHPQRCRSLIIVAQGADYQIAPHPFIWLLHELFLRIPAERILPAWFLRRIVVNYVVARKPATTVATPVGDPASGGVRPLTPDPAPEPTRRLPRTLIDEQFSKIAQWPLVYKRSVLPIIHNFDIRERLSALTMPILLINRADDALSPEAKTRWLASHLPNCQGYFLVPGAERFFMYSQAQDVNSLMEYFLMGLQGG
jgi:pimeloyl-ACP methyl ester carboxylesterase